jgi:hypothetical protein
MKRYCLFLIVFLLFLPSQTSALERFNIITTAEMEQMLIDRENGKTDFLLVNALDRMIYNHTAIPGSISIPLSSFQHFSKQLGEDLDKLIIPY